jgi:histidinol-phosphatase
VSAAADPAFLDHALAVARKAAASAAAVIGQHYRTGCEVEYKADDSPVTRADRDAEIAIRDVLAAAFPGHAIHGEEYGISGAGDHLWLVDPIDGTKGFVRRYPMFSTQIALMVGGELVLGVSAAPEYGETMWARRGGGAFFDGPGGDGRPVRIAAPRPLEQAALSTGNLASLAAGRGWQALGGLVPRLGRIRGYGDFLHYHLLARGCIDAVIESDVNLLDIAALAVIVREAGGVFTDLDGRPVGPGTRSVLAAEPALHAGLLPRFEGWRDA